MAQMAALAASALVPRVIDLSLKKHKVAGVPPHRTDLVAALHVILKSTETSTKLPPVVVRLHDGSGFLAFAAVEPQAMELDAV